MANDDSPSLCFEPCYSVCEKRETYVKLLHSLAEHPDFSQGIPADEMKVQYVALESTNRQQPAAA